MPSVTLTDSPVTGTEDDAMNNIPPDQITHTPTCPYVYLSLIPSRQLTLSLTTSQAYHSIFLQDQGVPVIGMLRPRGPPSSPRSLQRCSDIGLEQLQQPRIEQPPGANLLSLSLA